MENPKSFSSDDIFNKWIGILRTEAQDTRYLHRDRPELLEELISQFFEYGIDYEDVKFFKKRVVLALTTEEGRKNQGKYKGWKDCVESDFEAIAANFYVARLELSEEDDNRTSLEQNKKVIRSESDLNRYHPENPVITEWCKDRFGQDWTPELNKEAHLVGGIMNIVFQEEVFESEWILNPDSYPIWYKKACAAG